MDHIDEVLYPVFTLSGDHKVGSGSEKSRKEAREYFKALTRRMPYRILMLLSWHEVQITGVHEDDLRLLGHKVAEYISDEKHRYYEGFVLKRGDSEIQMPERPRLYDNARSMAMDMGLFLAVVLLQINDPAVEWKLRIGAKTSPEYHQAVVVGPGGESYEPIWQGSGWGESILDGLATPNVWAEYYLRWMDIVEGREPRSMRGV